MVRFIWKNWLRHKQRFILLLAGVLIISSGLSYLSTLTESNFGTVTDTLEKNWKSSYDLVVRPPGTRSVTEEEQLFEPNFLNGISGGISLDQVEQIKGIADVDIAAPLAVMGYTRNKMIIDKNKIRDSGVYRYEINRVSQSGVNEESSHEYAYFVIGPWKFPDPLAYCFENTEVCRYYDEVSITDERLLVGVDPWEEARLVGLDQAIVPIKNSRYFRESDISTVKLPSKNDPTTDTRIPILVSSQPYTYEHITYQVERLDLPFDSPKEAYQSMEHIREIDSIGLATIPRKVVKEKEYDAKTLYEVFVGSLTGINPYTGDIYKNDNAGINITILHSKSEPLPLSKVTNPFQEQWRYAYSANAVENIGASWEGYSFRPSENYIGPGILHDIGHLLSPIWIGFYNTNKLNIPKDPSSQTPLETYGSSTAQLVLDPKGRPVNPPAAMQATANPYGVLTSPPSLLTTIDAATKVLGDKAISAVRVKVAGVDDLSAASQAKVDRVAREIENRTGLLVDVMTGSAPQPVLVHIPAKKKSQALGWIEQTWIKIGEKTTLFNKTQMGFSIIMLLILFVAILYVQATQLASLLMRRREFAVMLAVGWRPAKLKGMIVREAAMLGLFAGIVSGAIGMTAWLNHPGSVSLSRITWFALLGPIIYILGSLWPVWLSGRIRPYETMRTGEIAKTARRFKRIRNIFAIALGHFLGKINRYTLSILSIALPTALLTLLLFITFHLKGVMYTSWIGQYVSVRIESQHYIAIAVTILICVLTTGELIWQNITERKPELFLLKSIGWRNSSVRKLILLEGWLVGFVSGILGYLIGLLITFSMYGQVPWKDTLMMLPVCFVPMIIGLIAAWIPAELAVRGFPASATRTIYSSSRKSNRWLFATATVFGLIVLMIGGKSAYEYISNLELNKQVSQVSTNMIKETPTTIGKPRDYVPQTVINGSKAAYDLTIEMDQSGEFKAKAKIDVTNVSGEAWDKLMFYMIPNVFTEGNKPDSIKSPNQFKIASLTINGIKADFTLHYDTLSVLLAHELTDGDQLQLEVDYTFTVPNLGPRFTEIDGNYFLAQFYPMLATYNKGWNKESYIPSQGVESYHTDFSDFHLHYTVPNGYTLATSANNEPDQTPLTGHIDADHIKELYVAIMKDIAIRKENVNGTEIRVFGPSNDTSVIEQALADAVGSFTYYEQSIGIYPRKQLDVVFANGNMEYPGIVTVGALNDPAWLEKVVAHELAHQWFYGVVSSDPYHAGYLDEGFTELTAALYLMDAKGYAMSDSFMNSGIMRGKQRPSNLSLDEYGETGAIPYFYVQAPLELWELFRQYEGFKTARDYLKEYYNTYAFKEVNSAEFVRFTKAYFMMDNDDFFRSWLKL